ncbi:MAG TPA: response regulator [Syntrophales bacterium]|nr:response regulator [Syntrophales bacterium]
MANALKILLVEDNKTDAVLIEGMINEGNANDSGDRSYSVIHKELLRDAIKYLAENTVDVILLDLSLPDSKGLDTVKEIGEKEKNTPIVVLTGLDDETVAVRALQHNVQDYLNKNRTDSTLLHRSMKYAIERFNNLREKERLIKELTEALENVKTLSGLLPICSNCKNIRNDDGYWIQVESFLKSHSSLNFTHSICPSCVDKLYPEFSRNKNVLVEKRKHPRKSVHLPALVSGSTFDNKPLLQTASVVDLSMGGLMISMPSAHEVKTGGKEKAFRMSIIFAVPETKKPITLECESRYMLQSAEETKIGLSLVNPDSEMYRALQNYLMSSISA